MYQLLCNHRSRSPDQVVPRPSRAYRRDQPAVIDTRRSYSGATHQQNANPPMMTLHRMRVLRPCCTVIHKRPLLLQAGCVRVFYVARRGGGRAFRRPSPRRLFFSADLVSPLSFTTRTHTKLVKKQTRTLQKNTIPRQKHTTKSDITRATSAAEYISSTRRHDQSLTRKPPSSCKCPGGQQHPCTLPCPRHTTASTPTYTRGGRCVENTWPAD